MTLLFENGYFGEYPSDGSSLSESWNTQSSSEILSAHLSSRNLFSLPRGTQLATINGSEEVQNLNKGNLLLTRDSGFQPILETPQIAEAALCKQQAAIVPACSLGENLPSHICFLDADMQISEPSSRKTQLKKSKRLRDLAGKHGIEILPPNMHKWILFSLPVNAAVCVNGLWVESMIGAPFMLGVQPFTPPLRKAAS